MTHHYAKETPVNSVDFGPLPEGLTHRQLAEEEATRDFLKSPRQLMSDVHDEILRTDRPPEQNLIHAFKRLGSMFGAAAEASNKASAENLKLQVEVAKLNIRLYWLTIVVSVLTVVATVAGCIQAYYSYASYKQDSVSIAEQKAKEKAVLPPLPAK